MNKQLEEDLASLTHRFEEYLIKRDLKDKAADARLDKLLTTQEVNSANIAELTKATKGVVEAWTVANGLSKFVKWLSSFAVVTAVVGGLIIWLKDFIK